MAMADEAWRDELSKFLAPEYVRLAFSMPAMASRTIWGFIEYDIDMASLNQPLADVKQVLMFLSEFFSSEVVQVVAENFAAYAESCLGLEYSLRRGKAVIAKGIVNDIRMLDGPENCKLGEFFGIAEPISDEEKESYDADKGWEAPRRGRTRKNLSSGRGKAPLGGRGLGRGAGRGLGRGGEHVKQLEEAQYFPLLKEGTLLVCIGEFDTPDKTLRFRSGLFTRKLKELVRLPLPYNPQVHETGTFTFYHGCQSASLPSFQQRGIWPPYRASEFSQATAFYLSNAVRHAFEHPLHHHPSQLLTSKTICVMMFELQLEVLHGNEAPPGGDRPFSCKWFPDTEEHHEEWRTFCVGNMFPRTERPRLDLHEFDIVIGPICIPSENRDAIKLQLDLPRNAPLTQVALCTPRAWKWAESCFKKVYCEDRTPL